MAVMEEISFGRAVVDKIHVASQLVQRQVMKWQQEDFVARCFQKCRKIPNRRNSLDISSRSNIFQTSLWSFRTSKKPPEPNSNPSHATQSFRPEIHLSSPPANLHKSGIQSNFWQVAGRDSYDIDWSSGSSYNRCKMVQIALPSKDAVSRKVI